MYNNNIIIKTARNNVVSNVATVKTCGEYHIIIIIILIIYTCILL